MIQINTEDLKAVITIEKEHPDGGSYMESVYLSLKELKDFINECEWAKKELAERIKKELK